MRDSQQQTSGKITDEEFVGLIADRPVIIVFAPSERSPSLESQLELLNDAEEEFTSRDAMLVQVLAEGDSYFQDRRLDETAVARLREKYAIEADEFSVVVIGESGEAVQRNDAPMQPEALFAHMDERS